jgi:hypothetical protein
VAVNREAIARRVAGWISVAIALLVGVTNCSGMAATWSAMQGPGLSPSDKQRLLSLGVAESLYNVALGVVLAVPSALAWSWLVWRDRRRRNAASRGA